MTRWNFEDYLCAVMATVVVVATIVLLGAFGWLFYSMANPPPPAFEQGVCVRTKMDGLKGMVTDSTANNVRVRFQAPTQRSDTRLFGPDGDIERKPYAIVIMKPFELEPCK